MKKLLSSLLLFLPILAFGAGAPYVVNLGGNGTNTALLSPIFSGTGSGVLVMSNASGIVTIGSGSTLIKETPPIGADNFTLDGLGNMFANGSITAGGGFTFGFIGEGSQITGITNITAANSGTGKVLTRTATGIAWSNAPTSIATQTNINLNQTYVNGSGGVQLLSGQIALTTAAVTGDAALDVYVDQTGGTAFTRLSGAGSATTIAVTLAQKYTNSFVCALSNGAAWFITNSSAGAGNVGALVAGTSQLTSLVGIGGGGSGSFIASLNGNGTNTHLYGLTNLMIEDNGSAAIVTLGTNVAGISGLMTVAIQNDQDYNISFIGTNGSSGAVGYHPNHNLSVASGQGEIYFSTLGSIALASHWIQYGSGGTAPMFNYYQDQQTDSNTNIWDSIPILFKSRAYFGANKFVYAGPGDDTGNYYAALSLGPSGTNGDGVFGFYPKMNNGGFSGTLPKTGNIMQTGITVGTNNPGLNVVGTLGSDGVVGITTNIWLTNNIMQFRNGLLVAYGAMDTDLLAWFNRVQDTSITAVRTNALITFVQTLKGDGTWGQLDALYPFAGGGPNTNGQNMISTSFTIKWTGTFTTSDSTGLQGNGSTGFGDTQWTPLQNNAMQFVYIKTMNDAGTAFFDGYTGSSIFEMGQVGGIAAGEINGGVIQNLLAVAPSSGTSLSVSRANSAGWQAYLSGFPGNGGATASVAPPAQSVYICARFNGGAANFSTSKFQGFAFGRALTQSQTYTLHKAIVALNTAYGR